MIRLSSLLSHYVRISEQMSKLKPFEPSLKTMKQ